MNLRIALFVATLIAALMLLMSCEDTDVTAPPNSTITLNASNVSIDNEAGETEGSTSLVAQVVDPNGIPLSDIPLFFSTTGGLLLSEGLPTETNENGVAIDELTLRLEDDPNEVTVTVKGTNLEAQATVEKIVNVQVPDGSTLTLTGNNVEIDQVAGEEEGSTQLTARLEGPNGSLLEGVFLQFTTTGGVLDSDNVITDGSGEGKNKLTLTSNSPQDQVTVTVRATTTLVASTAITRILITNPAANIEAIPPTGQQLGQPFTLDATGSENAAELECFWWTIDSGVTPIVSAVTGCQDCFVVCNSPDEPTTCDVRTANSSIISVTIGEPPPPFDPDDPPPLPVEPTLSIILRVSDDPQIDCDMDGPESFSNLEDSITYSIKCDLTDPIVEAGNNQSGSLASGPVSFNLQAIASDPEYPNLFYQWSCGSGTADPLDGVGQSVTCTYDSQGVNTATVTVTNDCQRQASDSVTLTVNN